MPSILPISSLSTSATDMTVPTANRKNDPVRVKKAAEEFEALMIGQMMKSISESEDSGALAEEKDKAGTPALQLAQEHFAQALASRGGLGLARVFTKAFPATDSSSATAAPKSPGPVSR